MLLGMPVLKATTRRYTNEKNAEAETKLKRDALNMN